MAEPKEVGEDRLPEMGTIESMDEESVLALADDGQPTSDEPSADADESETTVEKAQPESKTKPGKTTKRNLDDDEDFRKYKSARDKQLADTKAEYERRLREREDQLQQRELAQQQAALAGLQQGLANAVDDQERGTYIEQIAAIKSQAYVSQERAWAKYVAQEERDAGIEPGTFNPEKYRGQAGLMQFQRDIAAAEKDKLRKELAEAKKASAPDAIALQIQKEVAKALRANGLDTTVEAAAPASSGGASSPSWERDLNLVQTGRMTTTEFKKRHPE
jgi:hypothetical protein